MNQIKINGWLCLVLVVTSFNFNIFTQNRVALNSCLIDIYQACPNHKASLDGLPGGPFGQEAAILLAILAGRPSEMYKCPSLGCLKNSLNSFETCVAHAKLRALQKISTSDENQQLAQALALDPVQEQQRDQLIRKKCRS